MRIEHFKKIWATISKLEYDFSIRLTDIYLIKYNLGLCYFYQKKYDEAYKIFKEIIKNKYIIEHIFIWYRIGICLLEIELNELRKLREKNTVSEYISKNYGYETNYNFDNVNLSKFNEKKVCEKSSKDKINKDNYSNLNSSNPSLSKSAKNSNSPKKQTNKEKEECWDTVKFLNENLKEAIGLTNSDEKVEYIVNGVNQINEDLANNQIINLNRRRIILQNNIFTEISNENNASNNNKNNSENNENINNSHSNKENDFINDEEYNSDTNQSSMQNIIYVNKTLKLSECIYCLKKVISIYRNQNKDTSDKLNDFNIDSEELINFFSNKDREREHKKMSSPPNAAGNNNQENPKSEVTFNLVKQSTSIKSFNSIVNNSYLSLIFTLILDKNWVDALAILNEYERIDNFKIEKDIRIKLNNYLVEIYINLNQIEKAMEIIKNDFNNQNILNEKTNFYSSFQNNFYNDISYKMMLYTNMLKLHLINGNTIEAENCLKNIIDTFNFQTIFEIPSFIINHIIYLNLIKGNIDIVLNLIKFRRVNMNNVSPIPNAPVKSEKTKKN